MSFQHSGWVQLLGGIRGIRAEMNLRGGQFGAGGTRDAGGELRQQGEHFGVTLRRAVEKEILVYLVEPPGACL